jgi:S-adenosylmethionine decarboxylase
MGFGPHLVLDGYGCEYDRLTDLSLIYRFLDECPERIGMTKIMPPYVFKYTGANPKDWGVSGFVLIAESHISIHTFPEKRYLSLDIFSCKDFDPAEAIGFASERFLLEHYEHQLLSRGQEFPHDVIRSARIVESERLRFGEESRLRSAV